MRISIRYLLSLFLIFGTAAVYADTASILPPAKTTFFDQNGKPLTSGKVYFYVPGTTTLKTTWQDAAETIPNANPVILDAAGRAIVLGSGAYRQVVVDKNNNPVWDQVTSSAGSGGSGGVTVGDGIAVGTVLPWAGLIVPNNYALPYGQELSRTTYATLMGATSQITAVTCVSGSPILTSVADTSQINFTTSKVEAPCISGSASVIAKTASTITLSANAIVSVTTSATVFLYGNGNGVTTFNVPDFRGVVLPGRNNMGGAASSKITTSFYTDPDSTGGSGGAQSSSISVAQANLPNVNFATSVSGTVNVGGTISVTSSIFTVVTAASLAAQASAAGTQSSLNSASIGSVTSTGTGQTMTGNNSMTGNAASGGAGTPIILRVVQSSTTINYIIKILPDINLSIARCANLLDAGTSCTYNVGTSGATIPLLNTANTWSALQTFSSVAIAGGTITGMPNPTLASDVANKAYVDSVATGLNILAQTTLATAVVLPNTPTYANGASGVGATLTAGSNSTLTVDGVIAPLTTVVLVKNQASAFQNGIYTVTTAGSGAAAWVLTRATYFDQAAEMKAGSYTFVTGGTTNINTSYTLQTAVATVGTDPLNWVLFASSASSTSLSAANVLGRLTLAASTPIMNATSCSGAQCTAQTTLYFAPDGGYTVPIYNGVSQQLYPFACGGANGCLTATSNTDTIGVSLNLAGSANWTADSCYDVFYAYVSGVTYFGTGPAWSTCKTISAARGYTLNKYLGVYTNNAAPMTLRYGAASTISVPVNQATYLGTVFTNASTAGQIDYTLGTVSALGGGARLGVWNYWDRKPVSTIVQAGSPTTFVTYTYNAAVNYRPCLSSNTFQITIVVGLPEDFVDVNINIYGGSTSTINATAGGGFLMDTNGDIVTAPPFLDASASQINPTNAWGPQTNFGSHSYRDLIGSHYFQCYLGGDPGQLKFGWGEGVGDFTLNTRN